MNFKVTVHAAALEELIQAATHIAQQSSARVAMRWHAGLQAVIDDLETMPLSCPLARENGAVPGVELRQTVYKSHRLIFMINDRQVHILHLRHAAQENVNFLPGDVP